MTFSHTSKLMHRYMGRPSSPSSLSVLSVSWAPSSAPVPPLAPLAVSGAGAVTLVADIAAAGRPSRRWSSTLPSITGTASG